ncbi:uncharacterized protein LOC132199939 [Neocloeon triangulifer]|uniref:uncharacterized protein LOC132199939 n=1 Tax=Neocloeon triangulifer TaxID=2078957 RepID=UPI00286F9E34|nr:uncharacterized protein LOC132199939 [Neocloeon triangulifer]XP_059481037.1 uncharacterized protein LOC132199939 [Neocloeon triangulifer]
MSKRARRSADGDLELDQLLENARVKRSKLKNLRPLKNLALEKLAREQCAQTSLEPFQYLSPPLQKEILSYMASQQSTENWLSPAKADWMLELVIRLLNANIREFDFGIFGCRLHWTDTERDQKVWFMLVEKCPNLERISDKRYHQTDSMTYLSPKKEDPKKKFFLRNVMPYLLKFQKLKHIVLKNYICDSEDLAQLAHHFPKLQTLCVTIKLVYFDTLKNLFLLQNLEQLDINWCTYDFYFNDDKLETDEQTHYSKHFKAECMEQLPCLQYCSGGAEHHNFRPYRGKSKLSLKEIYVKGDFDLQLVPSLEKLHLKGPLKMQLDGIGALFNLTDLHLSDVKDSHVSDLLTHCGDKLHKLILSQGDSEVGTNPYELLVKCPNLRTLDVFSDLYDGEDNFFKFQVNANNFKYMKHFSFTCIEEDFPRDLTALVLAAPDLKKFSLSDKLNFSDNYHLAHLTEMLVKGRILQNLKSFEFICISDEPSTCLELVKFLCLLPVHAPRLKLIQCDVASFEFSREAKKSFLFGGLQQIGFKFVLDD